MHFLHSNLVFYCWLGAWIYIQGSNTSYSPSTDWLWFLETFNRQPKKMVRHTQIILLLLPANCLSMFDHLLELALKGLRKNSESFSTFMSLCQSSYFWNACRKHLLLYFRSYRKDKLCFNFLEHVKKLSSIFIRNQNRYLSARTKLLNLLPTIHITLIWRETWEWLGCFQSPICGINQYF